MIYFCGHNPHLNFESAPKQPFALRSVKRTHAMPLQSAASLSFQGQGKTADAYITRPASFQFSQASQAEAFHAQIQLANLKLQQGEQVASSPLTSRYQQFLKNNPKAKIQSTYKLAKSNGVQLVLPPDNQDLHHSLHQALLKFQRQQQNLSGLTIRSTPQAVQKILGSLAFQYREGTQTVYINPFLVHSPTTRSILGQPTHVLPEAVMNAAIEHEMVHFLHEQRNPSLYTSLSVTNFKPEARKTAREVSEYAAQNPLEFVAETGQKLLNDQPVSPAVLTMYEAFGGPPLSSAQRGQKLTFSA